MKIFIVIKYENVNTRRIEQGYGTKLYFKLVLNKLKIMKVFTFYLYPFGDLVQKNFDESFHVPTNQRGFLITNELQVNKDLMKVNYESIKN